MITQSWTVLGSSCYYNPHFINVGNRSTTKLNNWSMITQLVLVTVSQWLHFGDHTLDHSLHSGPYLRPCLELFSQKRRQGVMNPINLVNPDNHAGSPTKSSFLWIPKGFNTFHIQIIVNKNIEHCFNPKTLFGWFLKIIFPPSSQKNIITILHHHCQKAFDRLRMPQSWDNSNS